MTQWRKWAFAAVVCIIVFCAGQIARAQSSQATSPNTPDDLQQAMAEAAKPGPQHAKLMQLAGDYSTLETFTTSGQPQQQSRGKATLKAILGGRFLEETNSGESFGQPYQGLRLYGYNNGSKQYEAIWIYNGSTAFLVLDGTSDDNGTTIRYDGAFLGPNGQKQTLRVVVQQDDADHFTVKLLGEAPGGELTTLETVYTRLKKAPVAHAPRR